MNRSAPRQDQWSTSTMVLYFIAYAAFVFLMARYLDAVALPGWLPLVGGALLGFSVLMAPIIRAWERRMRVALSSLPQSERKPVRRAVVSGPAPADPAQREVAHHVAGQELRIAVRFQVFFVVALVVLTALVGFLAVTGTSPAWVVFGIDIGALLVQLLWPWWLRRRVELLAADVPTG